ncbi:helix-turn-helix domain-containing protein [Bosea sp. (in: a-proteobacteria)]|jgi:transcriptional regulator with XRE-family HTH domain|uniref:helix-turn-helix domain-containing protein n=1 Tax=Bosea sp. (in: a-proteobacteria) TaxID=1871050 RepID=UPI003F71DCE3
MIISPAQCRAARGLLGWSQSDLAQAASVSRSTLAQFETANKTPIANNLAAIRSALEAAGVTFLVDGEVATGLGVALKHA